jgi:hypothetical protein
VEFVNGDKNNLRFIPGLRLPVKKQTIHDFYIKKKKYKNNILGIKKLSKVKIYKLNININLAKQNKNINLISFKINNRTIATKNCYGYFSSSSSSNNNFSWITFTQKRNFHLSAHTIKFWKNSDSALNPVLTYSSADIIKEAIVRENKGKIGVYRWVNLISGKSSVNLGKRLQNYYNYNYITDPRRNKTIHKSFPEVRVFQL